MHNHLKKVKLALHSSPSTHPSSLIHPTTPPFGAHQLISVYIHSVCMWTVAPTTTLKTTVPAPRPIQFSLPSATNLFVVTVYNFIVRHFFCCCFFQQGFLTPTALNLPAINKHRLVSPAKLCCLVFVPPSYPCVSNLTVPVVFQAKIYTPTSVCSCISFD